MGWIRIDDRFNEHPKLARVGPLAWGVWLAGLAYCNRNLTDGFIPRNVAMSLACFEIVDGDGKLWRITRSCGMLGDNVDMAWVIDLLVEAGLWEEVPGGYQVHDYLDYQPSREDVLRDRERKRRAGRKGGLASARSRKAHSQAGAQAPAQANVKQKASSGQAKHQAEHVAPTQANAQAGAQAGAWDSASQKAENGGFEAELQAGAQAGAQAPAQAGAQVNGKQNPTPNPNPNPNPKDLSQECISHHPSTASLRCYRERAPDDDAQVEMETGGMPKQPRSLIEAQMMALDEAERKKAAEDPVQGVPEPIAAAFWAATGRLLLKDELPVLREMQQVATDEQITRAIRLGAERARRSGRRPKTLAYFRDVVMEIVQKDKRALGYVLPSPRDWVEVERVRQLVEAAEKLGKPVLPEWREFLREAERLGTKRPEGLALQ